MSPVFLGVELGRTQVGEDDGEPRFAPGERRGSYAYGTLYFEETRLRSRYMLCRGEPGACPPEEVMANLCDEFGLPNPQMIFFGLGANGRWNTGFATLDVFASKLINQVRSSGPFRSEARLGSVEDERAATALNDWGTLSDLDLTIIDNALIEHFFDDDDAPPAPAVDADLGAVDACLGAYARWDAHADAWLVVAIESPADTVYGWRREAERRAGGGLSDEQVRDFVGRFLPSYEAYCPALYAAAAGGGVDAKPSLRLDVDTTRSPVGAVRGG